MRGSVLSRYPVRPRCPDDLGELRETAEDILCTSCGRRFHDLQGLLQLLPNPAGSGFSTENEELARYSSSFSHRSERDWHQPIRTALNLLGNAYLYGWAKGELRRSFPTNGGIILDAACGDGILHSFIPPVHEYLGVDFSTRLLVRAQRLHRAPYLQADLNHLPFAEACFDIVVSLQALQYLNHPELAISEFARVLRPSGTLLLSLPNARSIKYRVQGLAAIQVQRFDRLRVEAMLSSHFEIKQLRTQGLWIPIPKIPLHFGGSYPEHCGLSWTINALRI